MKTILKFSWIILIPIIFVAMTKIGDTSSSNLTGKIAIEGSSTVYPITRLVVDEFTLENSRVQVTVQENGTGGGFESFTKGTIEINNASRKIKDKEIDTAKKNDVSYTGLKIGVDGITIIVNKSNTWANSLTKDQLAKIFGTKNPAKYWSDVDGKFPHEKINLYGPTNASGTYDFFGGKIVGKEGDPLNDQMVGTENDNEVISNVNRDKNAIGFLGFAYYEANADKVQEVKVDGIEPTVETIKNKSYLISRDLYIYVNNTKLLENESLKKFTEFYLDSAKTYVRQSGYIPLTDEEYTKVKAQFNAIK